MNAFRSALSELGLDGKLAIADMSPLSAAYQMADVQVNVPHCQDPSYIDCLLEACKAHNIGLLVPVIDTELSVLANARSRFAAIGTTAVISDPETIALSRDKEETAEFFRQAGIATPALLDIEKARTGNYPYPLFLKPKDGSMSIGSRRIEDMASLEYFWPRTANPMLMECVEGAEYTVDVYTGLDSQVHCAVPRRRIEVRSGEISKGLTEAVPEVIEGAMAAARALPGPRGVLTFQCMHTESGDAIFFELNARFGGGAPLSIQAGADFPRWLIEEAMGQAPSVGEPAFQENTLMLRYDEAVYTADGRRGR